MTRNPLEAFSDGVVAILITIMVLELRPPHGGALADLGPLVSNLLSYVLSFVFLAIYWNNHHHLLHAVQRVDGPVLWANVHLLFWLSLVPFVTAWMGEHGAAPTTVAAYGAVLLLAAVAYFILARALLRLHPKDSVLARALGHDWKGKASVLAYAAAITPRLRRAVGGRRHLRGGGARLARPWNGYWLDRYCCKDRPFHRCRDHCCCHDAVFVRDGPQTTQCKRRDQTTSTEYRYIDSHP